MRHSPLSDACFASDAGRRPRAMETSGSRAQRASATTQFRRSLSRESGGDVPSSSWRRPRKCQGLDGSPAFLFWRGSARSAMSRVSRLSPGPGNISGRVLRDATRFVGLENHLLAGSGRPGAGPVRRSGRGSSGITDDTPGRGPSVDAAIRWLQYPCLQHRDRCCCHIQRRRWALRRHGEKVAPVLLSVAPAKQLGDRGVSSLRDGDDGSPARTASRRVQRILSSARSLDLSDTIPVCAL